MDRTNCKTRKPILALGELLVDLVPERENMRIRDAGPVIKTASGSAGIFACAATLLGGSGGFIGKVGHDSLSRMVAETLAQQGVDVSHLTVSDEGQIGLAFLEYLPEGRNYQYYRKQSVGSLLTADDLDEDYIATAYAVHFPGMLLELSEPMREASMEAARLAREAGVLVSFDPNLRVELGRSAEAEARMMRALSLADVIAPTLEEGRAITGRRSVGDVVRALHALGPSVVALTRDKDGAVLSIGGQVALCGGIDVPVADPTGAGDTFDAALLVALQRGMALEQAALFANCAGTLAVTRRGAIGMALPTREQVEALMMQQPCTVERVRLEELE